MKLFEDVPSKVVMTCAKWHCALFVFTPAKKKTAYAVEDPTGLYPVYAGYAQGSLGWMLMTC